MQPTASRAELLAQCPYPFSPELVPEYSSPTEQQMYGTMFHAGMAGLLSKDASQADKLPVPAQQHVARSHAYLEKWLKQNGYKRGRRYVEVSLALDISAGTARRCAPPREEDHVYPDLKAHEIGGTADLIIVPPKSKPGLPILVLDHKTGYYGDFSQPEKLMQLRVLALAASHMWPMPLGTTISTPRTVVMAVLHSPADGTPVVYSSSSITYVELVGMVGEIERRVEQIGDGSMRPGAWCAKCPVRSQCPAKSADVIKQAGELVERATLVGSQLVMVGRDASAMSRGEQIGRLHLLQARFKELNEHVTRQIRRELQEDPSLEAIRPDGKRLKIISYERTVLTEAARKKVSALEAKLVAAGEVEKVPVTQVRAT